MVGNEVGQPAPWVTAHETLSRLARQRAAADAEEGQWLLRAVRSATHVQLGFASFADYIERLFGYQPRSTQEKLRVAEALETLPALSVALQEGQLSWSAVRELTRVAGPETETEWLQLARGKSIRQLEELIAGRRLGDSPSTPPDPSAQLRVLRFEVSAETFALFREAMAELQRRTDIAHNDDAALLEMARQVLGGSNDVGRSSYQIGLNICPSCNTAQQPANGQMVVVGTEIVEMAQCDAQLIPDPVTESAPPDAHVGARAKQTVPPALRRTVLQRDYQRCGIPGCRHAIYLDVHHILPRSEGGANHADNLITVCSAHHRALHRGEIRIEGNANGARVVHADGNAYGQPVTPGAVDVQTKVFSGLRGLGFREGEVRAVMAELRRCEELETAPPAEWLRQALRRLRRPGAR
jgi:hypothetical protein